MTFFQTIDDVSSAVIDIGREETRAGKSNNDSQFSSFLTMYVFLWIGYSGEDCPRSMIPSVLGVLEGEAARQMPARRPGTDDADMIDEAANAS